MRIRKFNEAIEDNVDISNERVSEIMEGVTEIFNNLESDRERIKNYYSELSKFRSKSDKSNDQIDDSSINLELVDTKMEECLSIINKINTTLENYIKDGRKFLY